MPLDRFLSPAKGVVGALGLALLAVMVLSSPPDHLVYDESYHVPTIDLLSEKGLTLEYLRDPNPSAAGPLYAVVHNLLAPVTRQTPLGLRIATFSIFLAVLATVVIAHRSIGSPTAVLSSFALIGVPFVWKTAGMALTEMPAALMFMVFVVIALNAFARSDEHVGKGGVFAAVAAGVFFSLSVCGRQNLLVALPAVVLLPALRRNGLLLAAFGLSATVLPLLLFLGYGGLTPASHRYFSGFGLHALLLSAAYASIMALLLDPGLAGRRVLVLPSVVVAILLSWALPSSEAVPFLATVGKLIPEKHHPLYALVVTPFLLAMGVYYIGILLVDTVRSQRTHVRFLSAALLLLILSVGPIIGFSTRYLVTAAPLLVLLHADAGVDSRLRPLAMLVGIAGGALSLATYYGWL